MKSRKLFIEHLNLSIYIKERMLKELKDTDQEFLKKFYASQSKDYRNEIEQILKEELEHHDFELLTPIIYHNEKKKHR